MDGYQLFRESENEVSKVVLKPGRAAA